MTGHIQLDLAFNVVAQVLIHFWWQGLVIALITIVVLKVGNFRSPFARYYINLSGLLLLLACPVATGILATRYYEPLALEEFNQIEAQIDSGQAMHLPTTSANTESFQTGLLVEINDLIYQFRTPILVSWLAGISLMLLRMSISWYGCKRLQRMALPLKKAMSHRFDLLKSKMGAAGSIAIRSANINQAVAVGLLKPMVLIPASWLSEIPLKSLEAIVAHELAHIRRFDLWVNLLQRFSEALFFYHPAVWWISKRIRIEREMCCDKIACEAINDPVTYAKTLSHVANIQFDSNTNLNFGANFLGGPKMLLLARIKNVLTPHTQPKFGAGVAALSMALLLALPIVGWAALQPEPSQQDEEKVAQEKKLAEEQTNAAREKAISWLRAQAEELEQEAKQEQQRAVEQLRRLKLKMIELESRHAQDGKMAAAEALKLKGLELKKQKQQQRKSAKNDDSELKLQKILQEAERLQSLGKTKEAEALLQQVNLAHQKMQIERQLALQKSSEKIKALESTKLREYQWRLMKEQESIAKQEQVLKAQRLKELVDHNRQLNDQMAKESAAKQDELKAVMAEMKAKMADQQAQIEALKAALAQAKGSTKHNQSEVIKKLLDEQAREIDHEKIQLMKERNLREAMQQKMHAELQKKQQQLMDEKNAAKSAEDQRRVVEAQLRAVEDLLNQQRVQQEKAMLEKERATKALLEAKKAMEKGKKDKDKNDHKRQLDEIRLQLSEVQKKYSNQHPQVRALRTRKEMLEDLLAQSEAKQKKNSAEHKQKAKKQSDSPSDLKTGQYDMTSKQDPINPHLYDLSLADSLRAHIQLAEAQKCSNCHKPSTTSFKLIDSNQCPTIEAMKSTSSDQKKVSDASAMRKIDALNTQIKALQEEIKSLKKSRAEKDKSEPLKDFVEMEIKPTLKSDLTVKENALQDKLRVELQVSPNMEKSRPKKNSDKKHFDESPNYRLDFETKLKPNVDLKIEPNGILKIQEKKNTDDSKTMPKSKSKTGPGKNIESSKATV